MKVSNNSAINLNQSLICICNYATYSFLVFYMLVQWVLMLWPQGCHCLSLPTVSFLYYCIEVTKFSTVEVHCN